MEDCQVLTPSVPLTLTKCLQTAKVFDVKRFDFSFTQDGQAEVTAWSLRPTAAECQDQICLSSKDSNDLVDANTARFRLHHPFTIYVRIVVGEMDDGKKMTCVILEDVARMKLMTTKSVIAWLRKNGLHAECRQWPGDRQYTLLSLQGLFSLLTHRMNAPGKLLAKWDTVMSQHLWEFWVHVANEQRNREAVVSREQLEQDLEGTRESKLERKSPLVRQLVEGKKSGHERINTGKKPYQCRECDRSFSFLSSMKRHTMIHTGEKPHMCQHCGRRYRQKGCLNTHMTTHTGEKRYMCQHCGRRYRQKTHLNTHMTTHARDKPYRCQKCDQSFSFVSRLKRHTMNHMGDKQ